MNFDNENLYQLSNSSFILNDNDYHRQLTLVLYLPFFIVLMVDLHYRKLIKVVNQMNLENKYFDQILVNYFHVGRWKIREGQSGANNTTRFIAVNDKDYVLRIYETHQDEAKVKYEHSVLLALKDLPLSFSIPVPVLTREGNTLVRTEDGKIAGLFHFLEGENPALDESANLTSFGKTTALLSKALAKVQIENRPVYRPYYEIESAHPRCSMSDVNRFCTNPSIDFADQASELLVISEQLSSFRQSVPALKQLPHQLVHGDLNASNILVNVDGKVSSVLDFEFVTSDLRVMELAVCLSDFIRPGQDDSIIFEKIKAFLSGYGSAIKLCENEVNVVPILINLRGLDVFIHFLGRYLDGIDSIDTVKQSIQNAALRGSWLKSNKEKLISIITEKIHVTRMMNFE